MKLSMRNGWCEKSPCARQGCCRIWQEKYSLLIVFYKIKKPIKYGENKPNRTRSSVFMHTQSQRVTIQGNITAMRYRNDVIWSVLLLHISANLRMMLARDYASCHAARSTLVMRVVNNVHKLRWPSNSLDLNPIDHLQDLLKDKVPSQLLQLNLHAWYL